MDYWIVEMKVNSQIKVSSYVARCNIVYWKTKVNCALWQISLFTRCWSSMWVNKWQLNMNIILKIKSNNMNKIYFHQTVCLTNGLVYLECVLINARINYKRTTNGWLNWTQTVENEWNKLHFKWYDINFSVYFFHQTSINVVTCFRKPWVVIGGYKNDDRKWYLCWLQCFLFAIQFIWNGRNNLKCSSSFPWHWKFIFTFRMRSLQ